MPILPPTLITCVYFKTHELTCSWDRLQQALLEREIQRAKAEKANLEMMIQSLHKQDVDSSVYTPIFTSVLTYIS